MKGYKAPALSELKRLREAARQTRPHAGAKAQQTDSAGARQPHPPDPATEAPTRQTKTRAPELTPEDHALFRRAMQFVKPLPRRPRARVLAKTEPHAILQARRQHAEGGGGKPAGRRPLAEHLHKDTASFDPEANAYLQSGAGVDLLRGLRRGRWVPQATLDLHGSTLNEARERLARFLDSCLQNDVRCVRIIHGKGIGSRRGQAVLKVAVRQQLSRLAAIQAWVQCAEKDGGAGALHALLRMPAARDTNQARRPPLR